MDPGEFQLWVSLNEARAADDTGTRTALLEDLVVRAGDEDVPRVLFLARRDLADAYRRRGHWDLVYRLLHECLADHDRRPWRFTEEDVAALLQWYAWLVECMVDFPDFGLDEIDRALDDVEHRFLAAGRDPHEVHSVRRGVAAHLGDWEAAERAFLRWTATAAVDEDDRWLDVVGIEQALARGDADSLARAHALAAPFLAETAVSDEPTALVRCLILLPLAEAGRWDEAVLTYRRLLRGMSGEVQSLEDHGRLVEFCALTGNEAAGVDRLSPMKGFESRKRPLATMEFATSVTVLAEALVRTGRGDTRLDLGDDPNSAPFHVVAKRMRRIALESAERFDRRNGSTVVSDRVLTRLAARPLADFLPLGPTSRPPLRAVTAGLPDAVLLERARQHDLRCEQDEARACLAAISTDPAEPVAAGVAELRARFFQDEQTETTLRHSVEVHRRYGDHRSALLTHCWLGLWIVYKGRIDEGITTTASAVTELRTSGDDSACAWGEHWLAHVLAGQGRNEEAHEAVTRGKRHAETAHDLLALGSLLDLESGLDPTNAIEPTSAALSTFIKADAPEKALESLARLKNSYDQLDDQASFRSLVDHLLTTTGPNRLHGHLRYLRACALIADGNPADAADDLNEAIGQASLREGANIELWYQSAHANYAAGRHEDAIDAGLTAANWLDHLRDTENQAWSTWADQARYLVAQSYLHLNDHQAALRELRRLTNNHGPLSATAFIAGTELLEQLGHH